MAKRDTKLINVGKQCVARDGKCMAAHLVPNIPCHSWLTPQHTYGKGAYPEYKYDLDKLITLCFWCHSICTDNPRIGAILGFVKGMVLTKIGDITDEMYSEAVKEFGRKKAMISGYNPW